MHQSSPTRGKRRIETRAGVSTRGRNENSSTIPSTDNGPPSKRLRSSTKIPPLPNQSKQTKVSRSKPKPRQKLSDNPEWHDVSEFQALFHRCFTTSRTHRHVFIQHHRDLLSSILPPEKYKHFAKLLKETPSLDSVPDHVQPPSTLISPCQRVSQPKSIKGQLKNYQITGLSFLVYLHSNGMNGILGDEMGLGKTLQTLALFVHLRDQEMICSQLPHLIICPLSVLSSWANEIQRWTNLTFVTFHGTSTRRHAIRSELIGLGVKTRGKNSPDLVISTYESFQAEESWFKHRAWGYVVLDEGHRIKNHAALISQALKSIKCINRLILTGTPVQNNLIELWSLFYWLLPEVFPESTRERFHKAFDLTAATYDSDMLNSSHRLLKLLMLRRTKESVKGQLAVPPREEIDVFIPMSSCQRFWTKRLIMRCDATALKSIFDAPSLQTELSTVPLQLENSSPKKEEAITPVVPNLPILQPTQKLSKQIQYALEAEKHATDSQSFRKLMNLLMQLRKVCNHPYLMPNSEPEPFETAQHLVDASSKLVLLDKLLKSELPKGKRVLIFSNFTSMLDVLEDFLRLRSIDYLRLDGSTPVARRNLAIRIFQQPKTMDPLISHGCSTPRNVPIFLISTKAGGLGINLTAADTVILYDSSWNPQVDIQAIARAHRIGQTNKVTVYRLICAGSVEQQMLGRLRKKLYLSLKIMDSNPTNKDLHDGDALTSMDPQLDDDADAHASMTTSDLCAILRDGASSLYKHWGRANDPDPSSEIDEDESSGYNEFLNSSFEEIIQRANEFAKIEETKLQISTGLDGDGNRPEVDKDVLKRMEQEEIDLLRGAEVVRCQLFEGKKYTGSNRDILREWDTLQSKRVSKSTTKLVDGHIVSLNSITNSSWQAVQTLTSDPALLAKLQDKPRTKKKFEHEEACLVCHEHGHLYMCAHCPRVAHYKCLGYTAADIKKMVSFTCSQHRCVTCKRPAAEAGGMLYRCQTCSDCYCEDCLPEENFYSMGDTLPEFLLLGYGQLATAHYIRCTQCLDHFNSHPLVLQAWNEEEERIKNQLINFS